MADFNINGVPVSREVLSRYNQLMQNPAYWDKRHLDHQLVVAEVRELLDQVVANAESQNASAATGSAATMDPAAAHQRIGEIEKHPGYLSRSHPEHATLVAEMSSLYRQIAPAEDGGADDGPAEAA